jgi:Domain of unknown function (DUF4328)
MEQILDQPESGLEGIKDNSVRAKWAVYIFITLCVIYFISIVSGLMELSLLEKIKDGQFVSNEEADFNDMRQGLIAMLEIGFVIASVVFFLRWFILAYHNLHNIGVKTLEYSKSQASWSFFIPFVNLVRPFKIVREIIVETQEEITKRIPDYIPKTGLGIVGLWWAFFVIRNLAGNVALRVIMDSSSIENMIVSTQTTVVLSFFDIITAVVTIIMIKQISKEESIMFEAIKYQPDFTSNSDLL